MSTPGWTPGPRPPRADTARNQKAGPSAAQGPHPSLAHPPPRSPKAACGVSSPGGTLTAQSLPRSPLPHTACLFPHPCHLSTASRLRVGPRWRSPDDGATGQGSPVACESGAGPSTRSHLLPEPPLCRTLDLADDDAENGGWTPTSPASPLEWVKPARAQHRGCHPGPARPHMTDCEARRE